MLRLWADVAGKKGTIDVCNNLSMKQFLCLIFCFSSLLVFSQVNTNLIKNTQEKNAVTFITLIEKGDTANAFKLLDESYYLRKKANLLKFYSLFNKDLKFLPTNTKRYSILVFPEGYNLFRYRYIDNSGTILQVDISYKVDDINSKIIQLGLITTKSFKKIETQNRVPKYDFE